MFVGTRRALAGSAPSELITNGTFDTDVTGWTGSGATPSWSSGKMIVTADGAGNVLVYQGVTGLTVGATYRLTATARRMDANSSSARCNVYDNTPSTTLIASGPASFGTEVSASVDFSAPADGGISIACIILSAAGAGAQGEYDNISLKRV